MKNKIFPLLIVIFFGFVSCEDFIEKDISGKHVSILAPPDGFSSNSLSITFWWEELDGAEQYRLQIVQPNFSSIQNIILDSTVTETKFTMTFAPGSYQWRIKAINNGGDSDYLTRSFTIDSSANLSNVKVILLSPPDNYSTNNTSNTFKWDSVFSANEYRFQIINLTTNGTVTDVTLPGDSFVYSLPAGNYKWQVRAQNNTSNSSYSSRLITIDLTAPSAPVIISPTNGDSVTSPVNLVWNRDTSAIGDSLFIYNDSLLTNENSVTYTTDTTFQFADTTTQYYYWRLKSKDNAGNQSNFTTTFRFLVQ